MTTKKTITVDVIGVYWRADGEGRAEGFFSGGYRELKLPEDCTIEQAIQVLETIRAANS